MNQPIRQFITGATRDSDADKIDFEGFLSPLVLQRYGEYMNRHRKQSDGTIRDSDNWQKGIPLAAYMKSLWRHLKDAWAAHRGYPTTSGEDIQEELCALIFNSSGYLHELLKAKQPHRPTDTQIDAAWSSWMARGFQAQGQYTDPGHHPMHAESLRDEFLRDDEGTGV